MQSQPNTPPASRALWVDWIRGIGILLVILGHVSGSVVYRWLGVPQFDWKVANILNVIARSCVPLLFMVSGALLLQPREESLRDFYRKRVKKVFLPFLFFSVLYLVAKQGCFDFTDSFAAWQDRCYGETSLFRIVRFWTLSILFEPAEYHLWFMYELFIIYMLTPVLRAFVKNASAGLVWYFLALWFMFGPLMRLGQDVFGVSLKLEPGFLAGYVGYFVLGYALSRIRIPTAVVWAAAVVYVLAGWFTASITFSLSKPAGTMVDTYQNLLGVNIVFLSTSLFIVLKWLGEILFSRPRPRLAALTVNLTAASFGMYLVHVFILEWLKDYDITPISGNSLLMIPVTTLAVFIISWAIIAVLMKIPYLRALVA